MTDDNWQDDPKVRAAALMGIAENPAYTVDQRLEAARQAYEIELLTATGGEDLNLPATDLRTIAQSLEDLAKVGARVVEITVGVNLVVTVRRHDDQRDGVHYTVTKIRRGR